MTEPRLTDGELPELFRTADTASLHGQRVYIRATKIRLSLAVAAAIFAAVSVRLGDRWDLAALAVACAFIATLMVELWLLTRNPERDWYDGRAFAESIKTLSWRYSVGAAPFVFASPDTEAERQFIQEVQRLISEAPADSIVISDPVRVTEQMRALRKRDLALRKHAYLEYRIQDQLKWYSSKAKFNSGRARGWRLALISIEGTGIIVALLKAGGVINFDLPGVLAALLGAGSAWFAVRQYEALARAYKFAANDLSMVYARLQSVEEEDAWARESADAEEAISREHTMWRASRGALPA
ncbi:DUF4231 domain-containing protein [Streptomyces samsunensis]|uniref:DUF4231 domain-containing protein n=1 Tax=Streptomyces malaysiensis TaxID=92644 RepID=UPI001582E248|nr:DUF4231 domain-containing protein [Streptomyces samsunensis]NUH38848.1 DUF4231 domain-containing protein [Streptomyces samsunensis]